MGLKNAVGFSVRLLALGEAGARALGDVAGGVAAAWGGDRALDAESLCAGDDRALAERAIRRWCDRERVDVVLTVGRAGHRREDFAPELTAPLLDRALPGVEERMHLVPRPTPEALLSRGRAGLRRGTLVVNLPAGGARAVAIVRLLGPILDHALEKARGGGAECGAPGKGR